MSAALKMSHSAKADGKRLRKGLVGVAASPISGVLSAASKLAEGVDATTRTAMELGAARRPGRKRLPRPFTGDRGLRPFSLHAALGQALLAGAQPPALPGGAAVNLLVSGISGLPSAVTGRNKEDTAHAPWRADVYEDHFILLEANVLVLTNRRVMLLSAPDFIALRQGIMSGSVSHVTDVPGGTVVWQVPWPGVLAAELVWHTRTPGAPADGVLVHRVRRGEEGQLFHDVHCRPSSQQAQEVLDRLQEVRYTYHVLPRQEATISMTTEPSSQQQPNTILSLGYDLVWNSAHSAITNRSKGIVTIWRPKGPRGYTSLGDIAMPGQSPPSKPVRMYKDTSVAGNSESLEDAPTEPPRLAMPIGYSLMLRESSYPAVTIWKPVAPRGYVEMGCVAWPGIAEPPLGLVRCMRKDLAAAAEMSQGPIWVGVSGDHALWKCSLWTVENAAGTFVAAKGDAKPQPGLARAPVY